MSDETCERIQAWTISAADRTVTTEGPDTDPCTGETITRIFVEATPLTLAAAELLAACKFALDVIGRQSDFYRKDAPLARLARDIEAAVAKAEGRQAR